MAVRYENSRLRYPIGAHSFRVSICGTEIGFSRISGIDLEKEISSEELIQKSGTEKRYESGIFPGEEFYMHMHRHKRPSIFVLEKALLSPENAEQKFILNCMKVGTSIDLIEVFVYDADHKNVLKILFKKCCVQGYGLSDLDAAANGYITQRITLQYTNMELIPQ
ncbi:MAG: hypothetical protein IJ496_07505 [Ruminococcus sp.]|nr:hypothetical protein [Ruminococcus sp.]